MKALKETTDNPELNARFNRVLQNTLDGLEESGLRYVFIGGIASGGLGRPRSTHDIDVFVRPEDAELALRALAKKGFRVEKTDPVWLYKGFQENILVDIIFKSKGEIYLDSEMYQKSITAEFHGKQLRLVAPEDLIVIKSMAHSELTPNHWHDALALLSHANIDWEYLLRRARKAPRRILSLLLYAQSNDIWVPKQVVDQLYMACFGDFPLHSGNAPTSQQAMGSREGVRSAASASPASAPGSVPPPSSGFPGPGSGARATLKVVSGARHDVVARIRERLAEDPRTNELDILVDHANDRFLLRGEVLTSERREAVANVVKELFPDSGVENQIRVSNFPEPSEAEEVK